jgi:O-antigen ligase
MMVITLAATTSRSGFIALVVSAMTAASLSRGGGRYGLRVGAIAAIALVAVAAWLNPEVLAQRIMTTIAPADPDGVGRLTIWRDTLRIIHDFPWLGTGAGTFQDAMFVYQRASREVLFNHAHDEYLQILTEGGVTLLAVVAVGVVLLARSARTQLDADSGAHRFIRVGACSGIVGIAVQSIWETGLRAPANLLLIALLAAIAVRPMDRMTDEKTDA